MANSDNVEQKLDRLAEKLEGGREDSLQEVQTMRASLKEASMRKNLAKNPAMQKLIGFLRKRDASITMLLENKEELPDIERGKLFSRRKEVRFILSFFDAADRALASISEQLDYQLSDEIKDGVDNE